MGIYLNPGNSNFSEAVRGEIYVDKTMMLSAINGLIDRGEKYICMSRPRRFGKTIAGKGYADVIYIPFRFGKPAMIIELKHNKSTDSAIDQIRKKEDFRSLDNYAGEILFVGINYDEEGKTHTCKIERFEK